MSGIGLIAHTQSGLLTLDTTTGLSRILGETTATSAGSVTSAGFGTGTPFVVSYPQAVPNYSVSDTRALPSISGTTLSWTGGNVPVTFVYGVYAGSTAGRISNGAVGFYALNGNQATQIDSFYTNHAFLQTIATSFSGLGANQTITVTASYPLIAYRGTGMISVVTQKPNGDGTWTIVLVASTVLSTSGTLYLFDVLRSDSARYDTDIALQICNESTGSLCYDSRVKCLKIVGSGGIPTLAPAYYETSTLSQDNLAVLIDPGLFTIQQTRSNVDSSGNYSTTDAWTFYVCGAGINGTTLTCGGCSWVGGSIDASPAQPDVGGGYYLVDVSGF